MINDSILKCKYCGLEGTIDLFSYKSVCKKCRKKNKKEWYDNNKDYYRLYNSTDGRKLYFKEYQKNNKEKLKIYGDEWYITNANKISEKNSELHQNKRSEIIYYYSNGEMRCNNCGERIYEFLEIDHLNGGGHQHYLSTYGKVLNDIIKNNFPENYQILCSNCNIKKLKLSYDLLKDKYKNQKAYNRRIKNKALLHYSPKLECQCCGENNLDVLTIDHIKGNGRIHRREINGSIYKWLIDNNFPEGYRVLCQNCNSAIGKCGYCPHIIK